jgi:hypothetical protein
VGSREKYLKDLPEVRLSHLLLVDDHKHCRRNSYNRVAQITKHDGKQEWESDDGVKRWVDLLVRRYAISVDHRLEALGEPICAVEGWRLLVRAQFVQDWRDVCPRDFLRRASDANNCREGGKYTPWLCAEHLG